jgi:hypothetical protein
MSFFKNLFGKRTSEHIEANKYQKARGDFIAEITEGESLIEGEQTWEYAKEKNNDIEYMIKCCDAELKTMKSGDFVPAPYYFERVAILFRREKKYQQEVESLQMIVLLFSLMKIKRRELCQIIFIILPKNWAHN